MGFGKTHTKPIPALKNGILQATTSSSKKQQAKSRSPCGARTFRNRPQQAATGQNRPCIIGNDEVGSSNLPSSSRKILETARFRGFFLFFARHFSGVFQQIFQQNRLCSSYMAASSLTSSGFSARIWRTFCISPVGVSVSGIGV